MNLTSVLEITNAMINGAFNLIKNIYWGGDSEEDFLMGLAFSIDKHVVDWNPNATFKFISVFTDVGFKSIENTNRSIVQPPLHFHDWPWNNMTEIQDFGLFSARELGKIVNENEFSMEFLLTSTTSKDYEMNFIESKFHHNPLSKQYQSYCILDSPRKSVLRFQKVFTSIKESFEYRTTLSEDIFRHINNLCWTQIMN